MIGAVKYCTCFSTYLLVYGKDSKAVRRHVMLDIDDSISRIKFPSRRREVDCCVGWKDDSVYLIAKLTG